MVLSLMKLNNAYKNVIMIYALPNYYYVTTYINLNVSFLTSL